MDKYIKCPRCEINYILEKQKMCDVCKAELKLAPDIYSEDDDEDMVLCPICKHNYIFPEEDMCASCKENAGLSDMVEDEEAVGEDDWRSYLDDDKEDVPVGDDGVEVISFDDLQDEEDESYDEEEDDFAGGHLDYDDNFDDEIDDYSDDSDDDDDEDDDDEF